MTMPTKRLISCVAAALLALPLATDLAFKRGRPRPAWVEGP